MAVADEPLAVEIGRQILADGGNAADAAAAMGLALGVTLPSRAGLAAAGACILHDPQDGAVRILDFATPAVEAGPSAIAEPLALRGLRTLHAAYGNAHWASVVAPAERLARLGHPISKTFADDLQAVAPILANTSAPATMFSAGDGAILRAGDVVKQDQLAAALSLVRERGAGALSLEPFARTYPNSEQNRMPAWREPMEVSIGSDTVSVAPMDAVGGQAQALTLAAIADDRGFRRASPSERAVMLASALTDAFTQQAGNANGETALGTSFAAMSGEDFAVACGLSLGGIFGTLETAGELGFFRALGMPAGSQVLAGLSVWHNQPKSKMLAIGAGADFFTAATTPMIEAAIAETPPRQTITAPRLGWEPRGSNLIVERTFDEQARAALGDAGYRLRGAEALGRAAYIVCDWDRQSPDKYCTGLNDPRGQGSAFLVEELNIGLDTSF